VQLDAFTAALEELTAADVRRIARSLDSESLTDEVDWWRATIAIDRAIRHGRCARHAARAAAEVARGLAAGPAAQPIVRLLLEPWAPIVAVDV